ncbi:MAG: hypothetical protein IPH95_21395 [Candidatus Promineofilum sp.]|nr:hypothetical protein [Promineifilum sp.]
MTRLNEAEIAHQAKSPQAAAVAGIAFAVLFAAGVTLIRLSAAELGGATALSDATRSRLNVALALMPFAGIAFLWFVGVVRHHLGAYEDQFFATVSLGSGLLFVGMSFVAFAVAGGTLAAYQSDGPPAAGVYALNLAIISQAFNTYALKMAGVFMFSLGTLWRKTGVMPRSLTLVTYVLALVMMVSLSHNLWLALLFPAWVLLISVFILVSGLRRHDAGDVDGAAARVTG